jgi:hypothetical protein
MHSSRYNHDHDTHEPHPWLREKVYEPLRQRTIALVRSAVDVLLKDKQRISLATVAAKSKEVDPEQRGVSESAILDNQEARAYYEQHRTWQGTRQKGGRSVAVSSSPQPGPIKADRDEQRVRLRYLRMNKEALVERLLAVERTYAEERTRWLSQQDDVLTWHLRAEAAETQLQDLKAKANRQKQ